MYPVADGVSFQFWAGNVIASLIQPRGISASLPAFSSIKILCLSRLGLSLHIFNSADRIHRSH